MYDNFMDDEICEHTEQQVNVHLEQNINKKILHHKVKTNTTSLRISESLQLHGAPERLVVLQILCQTHSVC
jgi:hypothetical protein